MRSVLRLGVLPLAALAAAALGATFGGCTITTNDAPVTSDGGTVDTGTPDDTGTVDTGTVDDTGTSETAATPGVVIKAQSLIDSTTDDTHMHDFGGGSTFADITAGNRIAYGFGKVGTTESSIIGKDSTGAYVDGRIEGLPAGTPVTITVTGYLRGVNGDNDAVPNVRIPWATTTCTATPSATADVVADCTVLLIKSDLKGVLFSADVLPDNWCTSKGNVKDSTGKTLFDRLRARTPYSGTAVVSKTVSDCQGVIWVPWDEFKTAEDAAGKSEWSLSLETNDSATACTATAPCVVDRKVGTAAETDIYVVGSACRLDNTTAPRTPACF